jgi:nitroreductase
MIKQKGANLYLLRRNIHRIEKGILMRPRKNIFAVRFIEETVDCFNSVVQVSKQNDDPQVKWAYDVLTEYFKITAPHPLRDRAYKVFSSISFDGTIGQAKKYVPYQRAADVDHKVTIEDLYELAKYRRSVRWFTSKSVESNKIDKALEIASQSPTACNRQPYKFKIFQDKALVEKLVRMPMGTGGFAENIKNIVVVIGDLSAYPFERDRHLIYIDSSLAVMSFIYGLEVQGIGSCVLNWPDVKKKEEEVSEYLGLKSDERVIMFMAIGYPDNEGSVAFSQKKSLSDLRQYN